MTARSRPAHYDPGDFARLRPVEDGHFWFVSRNNILGAVLATLAGEVPRAGAVLEIGCGTGNTLRVLRDMLPDSTLVGMDALHAGLLHARDRTPASLVEGRLEEMPFRKQFVLVGMFDVLEHIEDEAAALQQVYTLLRPGGLLFMTVPAYAFLHSAEDVAAGHFRRYTLRSLTRAVIGSGFKLEYATYLFAPLPPFVLLLRTLPSLLGLRRPEDEDLRASEHVREGFSARAINRLLDMESQRIRAGGTIPFGTSCLAVCIKE